MKENQLELFQGDDKQNSEAVGKKRSKAKAAEEILLTEEEQEQEAGFTQMIKEREKDGARIFSPEKGAKKMREIHDGLEQRDLPFEKKEKRAA